MASSATYSRMSRCSSNENAGSEDCFWTLVAAAIVVGSRCSSPSRNQGKLTRSRSNCHHETTWARRSASSGHLWRGQRRHISGCSKQVMCVRNHDALQYACATTTGMYVQMFIQYYIILNYDMLYSIMLCYTILYYTMLYYTKRYYTIVYYLVFYNIIYFKLLHVVPYCIVFYVLINNT